MITGIVLGVTFALLFQYLEYLNRRKRLADYEAFVKACDAQLERRVAWGKQFLIDFATVNANEDVTYTYPAVKA